MQKPRCRIATLSATTLTWTLLCVAPASADPDDQQVFTGFEQFNTTPGMTFVVGSPPNEATFSGDAFAARIGDFDLYHNGLKAWMVNPGGVGEVTFETNAAVVEFFGRAGQFASDDTVITAFDDGGSMVGSPVTLPPGQGFTLVSFTGSIRRLVVENLALSGLNSIDDFGYTPVAPLLGDFNNDGVINAIDYVVWRDNLGGDESSLNGNGNGSGVVDAGDYDLWFDNFAGAQGVAGSAATVPEPAYAPLILLGAALSCCVTHRTARRPPLASLGKRWG